MIDLSKGLALAQFVTNHRLAMGFVIKLLAMDACRSLLIVEADSSASLLILMAS